MLHGRALYPQRLFLAQIVETSFSLLMSGVRPVEKHSNHIHVHTVGSSSSRMPISATIAERRRAIRPSREEISLNFNLPVSPAAIGRHIG